MTFSRNFIVGVFVVAAFFLLTMMTVSLRQWDFLSRRATYLVKFERVKKLDIGAPVLLSGIQVGSVGRMEYTGDAKFPVMVTLRVDKKVRLYPNATVEVVPAQVIGDTTINIDAGQPTPGHAAPLEPGSTFIGTTAPQLEEILGNASTQINQISSQMNNVLSGMSSFINDPDNQAKIRQTLTNLASASSKLDHTLSLVNEEFTPLATSLKNASQRLDLFLEDAQGLSDEIANNVSAAGQSVQTTAGEIQKTAKSFSTTAQTLNGEIKANSAKLQSSLDQLNSTLAANKEPLAQSVQSLGQAADSLRQVLDLARNGRGTLGLLLTDPRPFEQLRQIMTSLSATVSGRKESIFPEAIEPGEHPRPAPRASGAHPE